MAEAAAEAEDPAIAPGLKKGPRQPATEEDLFPGTEGEGEGAAPSGENTQGEGTPGEENAPPAGQEPMSGAGDPPPPGKPDGQSVTEKNGENAPSAEQEQSTPGAGEPPQPEKPAGQARSLAAVAASASDDSGELRELLREVVSGEGGLGPDRALLAAEAVGALFSAPGGMSDRENAGLVIRELAHAGVDVGKMLAEIAEVDARDRAAVAAGKLRDELMKVSTLVHRMAASASSHVSGHLRSLNERAQGVVTAALMAQAVLDRVDSSSRKLIVRLDEVRREGENLGSGVGAAKVEVEAASRRAAEWVENAGTLGRGVWWWALVGGVLGGVLSGLFAGLVQRAVAGL